MSDPFDAFESALGASTNVVVSSNEDPAAEFLAREQAELAKIENDNFDSFGDFGINYFFSITGLYRISIKTDIQKWIVPGIILTKIFLFGNYPED